MNSVPDADPRPGPVVLGSIPELARGGPAVFLDRDGVLNQVRGSGRLALAPRSLAEVRIEPGAPGAADRLRGAGVLSVVVTNQPDVARGTMSRDTALEITSHVLVQVGVDAAFVCLHDDRDDCRCRKPRPGAFLEAERDLALHLDECWMIGDRWVDVAAGAAAGVRTVLIERPYSWERAGGSLPPPTLRPTASVSSLDAAIDHVLLR